MYPSDHTNPITIWRRQWVRTLQIPLSSPNAALSAATKKARFRVGYGTAVRITGFVVDCDAANKPSAAHAQFDLNTIVESTGTATSILSAIAQVSTGTYSGTGTIAGGSYTGLPGQWYSIDVDQGSDGKEYVATITYYEVL